MADSFTPTLNLTKPEINQSINTWGNKLNGDMDLIDQSAADTNTAIEALDDRVEALEKLAYPVGGIIMWSGALNTIPEGWALCDGTQGTPNLTDKFIVAAGSARGAGTTGGADAQTVGTNVAGAHSHGGATAATAITEAQMPSHQHGGGTDAQGAHGHLIGLTRVSYGLAGGAGGMAQITGYSTDVPLEASGSHTHAIATDFRGGSQGHAHGIVSDGNHAHSVTVATVPIYFALAFIMKLPAPAP